MKYLPLVLSALLFASAAPAQSLRAKTTLEEQTADATRILIGVVTTIGAPVEVTNDAGDVGIYTPVTLRVIRVIKGAVSTTLTLHIPGGTLAGITMKAPSERIPIVGERLRVFAKADGARWRPLNGALGLIRSLE